MVKIDLRTIVDAPMPRCFDLARSIEVHLLGTEQTGEEAIGGVTTGLLGPGQFVRWRARQSSREAAIGESDCRVRSPSVHSGHDD